MFNKLLIANRGEIACRIIRTAQKLGIHTVAVHSDIDAESLHVALADSSILVGGASPIESYLNIDRILEIAQIAGVDAVHPGYGFLSENPDFVKGLDNLDIKFVGPSAESIKLMGDKITAKRFAGDAGVSIIPGYDGEIASSEIAVQKAKEIGYPVMLKATAGGGGKGLRIARNNKECIDGFNRARSEALSSFGDDRILIEKYIHEPRHIEIQVIGDIHGNSIHLGERECSIQRRHQKIIEEAPSPFVDASLRHAMGEQALLLVREADYYSAGTVEFVVDDSGHFYFLEMNTRLQVEHPITEMVTGLDIVELMLKIADGEELKLQQDDVKLDGWAIEARIYAEDPASNFVPSVGRLKTYIEPDRNPSVRVDSGVSPGTSIDVYYDPMIAKLITHGHTRATAITSMITALHQFDIDGVTTNTAFLQQIIENQQFVRGDYSTNFIEQQYSSGVFVAPLTADDKMVLGILALTLHCHRNQKVSGVSTGTAIVQIDDRSFEGKYSARARDYLVQLSGVQSVVRFNRQPGRSRVCFSINNESYYAYATWDGFRYRIKYRGNLAIGIILRPEVHSLYDLMPATTESNGSGLLVSPMPGLLLSLGVDIGQIVEVGDELVVIEAMKMENSLKAERVAIVKAIHVTSGQPLEVGDLLMEFEELST